MFISLVSAAARPAALRQTISLNQGWEFTRIPDHDLTNADTAVPGRYQLTPSQIHTAMIEELSAKELKWQPAVLPHTAKIEPSYVNKPWQGICVYHRNLPLTGELAKKHVVLTLEGAMQTSTVWLNGQYVGGRKGGYLPVVIDLTGKLKSGANSLTVRLDNRDNPLVPPGKPTPDLDFLYWSGLYRDAFLTVTGPVHITNPFISATPKGAGVVFSCLSTSKQKSVAEVKTEAANDTDRPQTLRVRQQIASRSFTSSPVTVPPHGKRTIVQKISLTGARLWSPDHPNLYRLTTSLLAPQAVDSVQNMVGFRRLVFSRNRGLLVNGVPTRLVGTNRHQEYPFLGNALSDNASFRDMEEIKDAGFNCVRLSHYPQDPAVMAACDKLGLFAIVCAPGWQYDSKDPVFQSRVVRDIKQMVRWHRNHPSVLAWEASLNETYPPKDIAEKWYSAAHSEFTESDMTAVSDYANGFSWDWPYNQWDDKTGGRPQNAAGKPGYIREYGDWEFGGASSTSRQPMAAGEDGMLQQAWNFMWCHNQNRGQWPWTMGDGTWVMYDYHRGYDPTTEHSGMADQFRIPRYSYRFFQSQYVKEPTVFIANDWSKPPKDGKVVVFSNGDHVRLFLNGKEIGSQNPDSGPDTPYGDYNHGGNPWDGGNARNLVHPPFTFKNIAYQPGQLKAVAYRNGHVIARQIIRTPGKLVSLNLTANLRGVPLAADGADAVFVYVSLRDSHGQTVRLNDIPITVQVQGRGRLVSPKTVETENGIATFLVQASEKPGDIKLTAQTGAIKGVLHLTAKASN